MNSFAFFLGVIVSILGAAILLYSCYTWFRARGSRRWRSTEGVLDSAAIEEIVEHTITSGIPYYTFEVVVRYHFEVDGRVYHGTRRGMAPDAFRSRDEAAEKLRSLTEKTAVTAYYDSGDPSSSALEPGVTTGIVRALAIACSLLLTGLWLATGF